MPRRARRGHAYARDFVSDIEGPAAYPQTAPANWLEYVDRPETARELEDLRRSATRGAPFGSLE